MEDSDKEDRYQVIFGSSKAQFAICILRLHLGHGQVLQAPFNIVSHRWKSHLVNARGGVPLTAVGLVYSSKSGSFYLSRVTRARIYHDCTNQ